jgi:hypothetical protein
LANSVAVNAITSIDQRRMVLIAAAAIRPCSHSDLIRLNWYLRY